MHIDLHNSNFINVLQNELPTLDLCTNGSNGVVNDCLFAFSAAMANDTINVASMAVS